MPPYSDITHKVNTMSELQTAEETQQEDTATDLAPVELEATENTGEETQTEQQEPESQATEDELTEKTKQAINKKHWQYKEEERKRIAAEQELQRLRAESEPKAITGPVEIPPIPDAFDDDYESQVKARDAAIAANAEWNAQENIRAQQEAAKLEQQEREARQQQQELNATFETNTQKLGVDSDKVIGATETLLRHGIDAEMANIIMTDSDGPLMAMYFQDNPLEYDAFMAMPSIQRGASLAGVKAKASLYRPKTTQAPDPAPAISGKTAPADRGPAGATFE